MLLKSTAKPEKVLLNVKVSKHFTKWYNDAKFILKEEEAAIINYYVNSIKSNRGTRNTANLGQNSTANKTMKELIAESRNEMQENKEKHQTLVDWSSLHVKIMKHEKEEQQVSNFQNQHYQNKKPTKKL